MLSTVGSKHFLFFLPGIFLYVYRFPIMQRHPLQQLQAPHINPFRQCRISGVWSHCINCNHRQCPLGYANSIQPPRVHHILYICRKSAKVKSTFQPNRILIHKPTHFRLIIPEEVVMQPRFFIRILIPQPQRLV